MTNNGFPSRKTVERVQKMYSTGCRVELVQMNDLYSCLKPGDKGIVRIVDDTATVFVDWDCGSSLGIVYGVDRVKKL